MLCETILKFRLIGRDYSFFRMCLFLFFFNWFSYLFQIICVRGFMQSENKGFMQNENNSYLFRICLKYIVLSSLAAIVLLMVNLNFVLS